jgi:preprotein translocase subunit SecG
MRRLALSVLSFALLFALLAPAALAHDGGEGLWGETNDKVVTNIGYILIGAFPLLVLFLSLLQNALDKRKKARWAAAKGRARRPEWRGGW